MNLGMFDWILAIVLLVVGIMLLTGHGDAIMGGGPNGAERKELYDDKKMQRAFGIGFLLMAAANVITIFIHSFEISIAYMVFIVLIIVAEVIYVRKCCKK